MRCIYHQFKSIREPYFIVYGLLRQSAMHLNRANDKHLVFLYPKIYTKQMKSIQFTDTFDVWFTGLKDIRAKARIQMRIDRAEDGNFGDCTPIGEGVSEMRIHYGPGYRVYFTQRGMELVILLAGGDKSGQGEDINTALKLARQL